MVIEYNNNMSPSDFGMNKWLPLSHPYESYRDVGIRQARCYREYMSCILGTLQTHECWALEVDIVDHVYSICTASVLLDHA